MLEGCRRGCRRARTQQHRGRSARRVALVRSSFIIHHRLRHACCLRPGGDWVRRARNSVREMRRHSERVDDSLATLVKYAAWRHEPAPKAR